MASCLAVGAPCPSTSRHITRASANGPRGKRVPAASTLAASTPTTATSTPTPLAPPPTSVAVGKEVEESAMWAQIAVHEEWEKRGGDAAAAASSSGRSWQGPELSQAYERCAAAMRRHKGRRAAPVVCSSSPYFGTPAQPALCAALPRRQRTCHSTATAATGAASMVAAAPLPPHPNALLLTTLPARAAAGRRCGEVTSEYAKTFFLGTQLMTPQQAKAIWAIYVWCR